MNCKQNINQYIIWSPNNDSKFIKVFVKQIELFEIKLNQLDEFFSSTSSLKKVATYTDNEVIKAVSWQTSKIDENCCEYDDIIVIGLANGFMKLIYFIHNSGDSDEYILTERELRPKYLKAFLYLSWNPWNKNTLAQVVDKSKTPVNESAILIWEFLKIVENKVVTPTPNQNNLPRKLMLQTSNTNVMNPAKVLCDINIDQASYEYCRGDVINSFAWISQLQFICGVNNKCLKIFEIKGSNPIKIVNTEATLCLCIDSLQSNIITSIIDEKVIIWKEDNLDKPILTYAEEAVVENIEWNPLKQGYLCITFKEKPYVRILDTKIALINQLNEVEHTLIDRCVKSSNDVNVVWATWHRKSEYCIILLLVDETFEIVHLRVRRIFAWSVEQKFVYTLENYLKISFSKKETTSNSDLSLNNTEDFSKTKIAKLENYSNESIETNMEFNNHNTFQFLENDICLIMFKRAKCGYGLKSPAKDCFYSTMFSDNHDLKTFWAWIENASNSSHFNIEGLGNRMKVNPISGAIDGIAEIATVDVDRMTLEMNVKLNVVVSQPEDVHWNNLYDKLPFPKFCHSYRSKILSACGWPFDQPIEKWRCILESLENKERAAAMALVTLNFDVALQYLKRMPNDKGIDNEMLRLCLAGFNTQKGQASNLMWSSICRDVLNRLGNNRPYLKLIFNFLIVKNKNDLQFIRSLNILLVDKLAIASLYMDDESLVDFFNYISNICLKNGQLEMVAITGLRSKEFIDLLQAYANRTGDIQTVAIALLQANILTRNSIEKSRRTISCVECYRNMLDNWRMWISRADFDIENQYFMFNCNRDVSRVVKPASLAISKSNIINLNPISNQNQVYVACGFCGWKITQPSKHTTNTNRNSIQNKTRPDGSLYGNAAVANFGIHGSGCKSTICQHCRKPLPRCSVCLMNIGINGDISNTHHNITVSVGIYAQKDDQIPSNSIENWFMWCQKCKHGGHSGHLQEWFHEWNECPVSGCKCTCYNLDSSYPLFKTNGQKIDPNNIDL